MTSVDQMRSLARSTWLSRRLPCTCALHPNCSPFYTSSVRKRNGWLSLLRTRSRTSRKVGAGKDGIYPNGNQPTQSGKLRRTWKSCWIECDYGYGGVSMHKHPCIQGNYDIRERRNGPHFWRRIHSKGHDWCNNLTVIFGRNRERVLVGGGVWRGITGELVGYGMEAEHNRKRLFSCGRELT